MDRRKRAWAWTFGALAILAGPIGFRIWLESSAGKVAIPRLGTAEAFVFRDSNDKPVTKELLEKGVVVVINIPANCANCDGAVAQAAEVSEWIQKNLVIGYTEEKNPLHLFSTGGGYTPTQPGWRLIRETPDEGGLLPRGHNPQRPWLVVIDPWMVFAGAWDLSAPVDHDQLKRVLSRTTFEQYLGNYLARRTFMGPRREN